MEPKSILRLEGLAIFTAATAAYFWLGGPIWLLILLALVPDVSMFAYLSGPRIGSWVYNAFHTYIGPIALGAAGLYSGTTSFIWVACIWGAHIGVDRAVGYGLKYQTGFKATHLSQLASGTDQPLDPIDEQSIAAQAQLD